MLLYVPDQPVLPLHCCSSCSAPLRLTRLLATAPHDGTPATVWSRTFDQGRTTARLLRGCGLWDSAPFPEHSGNREKLKHFDFTQSLAMKETTNLHTGIANMLTGKE